MTDPETDIPVPGGDEGGAPAANQAKPAGGDMMEPWFLYAAAGLLLVIIAALAGLTAKYYYQAAAAKRELAIARQDLADSGTNLMSKLLGPGGVMPGGGRSPITLGLPSDPPSDPPAGTLGGLTRDQLVPARVTVDGESVQVLMISASAGEQVGLLPGDIVRVGPVLAARPVVSATTLPAAQPADGE